MSFQKFTERHVANLDRLYVQIVQSGSSNRFVFSRGLVKKFGLTFEDRVVFWYDEEKEQIGFHFVTKKGDFLAKESEFQQRLEESKSFHGAGNGQLGVSATALFRKADIGSRDRGRYEVTFASEPEPMVVIQLKNHIDETAAASVQPRTGVTHGR